MTNTSAPNGIDFFFPGDGEMATRCRQFDWSATSLGPVEQWAPALRYTVRTAMECPFALNLWCGRDKILIYNDAYVPLLGAKHPRALGRPGAQVWSEVWSDLAPMFDVMAQGSPIFAEDGHFVIERSDDAPADAWFTYSFSPVRSDSGEVVAYLNVGTETTSRIRAENDLREARIGAERAERRLRDVFAQSPGFLAVLHGPEHVFEFVNSSYLLLVGQRELVGSRLVDALPEVAAQGFVDLLDGVYQSGKPYVGREVPVMLQRTAGSAPEERRVDFVYQPLTSADGTISGIVAHGSDVTEAVLARQETEELLLISEETRARAVESEARYRFLANAIPVQVWTATPDGQLDYVSERAALYFGVRNDDVLGDAWLKVLHPDDVAATGERWARSIATGEPYEIEFRLREARTGQYRWHLARATAQRDERGNILRWFGSNTDIEDRRRAEAELQRLTHEATEANRAKSDFLAAMSHELRTPLNAIGGYTQLIELGVRGPITEEQRIDLSKIQRSKNYLDGLVTDVLNFAKAGVGRIEYRAENIQLRKTIDAVLEMIAPQVSEKHLRIDAAEVPQGLAAFADEERTQQILLNLLANALKFTPSGGTLSLAFSATGQNVDIALTDTGIGIPPEQIERIFEPFVQAKHALRPSDQGVGLGLAISRQLARAMDGELRVVSTVGVGSTFTLTLPRAV
jgi:PAS domain S-box-containing protein